MVVLVDSLHLVSANDGGWGVRSVPGERAPSFATTRCKSGSAARGAPPRGADAWFAAAATNGQERARNGLHGRLHVRWLPPRQPPAR